MKNNIICVIGQPGAGKDTLANYLEKIRGFSHISTGNIIRQEMRKEGIPTDRENMRIFSQKMREKVGNCYPASIAAELIVGNTVISGPRNVMEVEFFKNKFGENFILVAVTAPIEIRYDRVKKGRSRVGDDISFEEFKKQEEAECSSGTHELNKLLSIADYTIDNSGGEDEMFSDLASILEPGDIRCWGG